MLPGAGVALSEILWDSTAVILPHDEAGSGPAVVLIHAGIADRTMWSEHVERLADAGHRAVAVDLPGFGEARVAPGEQAPWADVLRTMDELSIVRAALVGNSLKGAVALRVALVAPDRVSALAFVSAPPPGLEPSPELEAAWEAEEAALQPGDIEAAVEAVVSAWTLPDASPELRDRVAAMQRRAFALQAEAPPTTEAPDPVEQRPEALARLSVPTLVAAGELDKRDFRQGAEAMARALPHARHAVIEGAGHQPLGVGRRHPAGAQAIRGSDDGPGDRDDGPVRGEVHAELAGLLAAAHQCAQPVPGANATPTIVAGLSESRNARPAIPATRTAVGQDHPDEL